MTTKKYHTQRYKVSLPDKIINLLKKNRYKKYGLYKVLKDKGYKPSYYLTFIERCLLDSPGYGLLKGKGYRLTIDKEEELHLVRFKKPRIKEKKKRTEGFFG